MSLKWDVWARFDYNFTSLHHDAGKWWVGEAGAAAIVRRPLSAYGANAPAGSSQHSLGMPGDHTPRRELVNSQSRR